MTSPSPYIEILLLDCNHANQTVVKSLIDTYFPDVVLHETSDYEAAVNLLNRVEIDLVISADLHEKGQERLLARYLRMEPTYLHTPILFLIEHAEVSPHPFTTSETAMNTVGIDYLTLPLQAAEFIAKVNNLLFFVRRQKQLEQQVRTLTISRELIEQKHLHVECVDNFMRLCQDPLNMVVSLTQLITLNQPDNGHEDAISKVREASIHLLSLSNQFLDLSRAKSGKLHLSPNTVELTPLLIDTLNTIQPLAEEKGINLHHYIEERVPNWIIIDGRRLGQILHKLLTNAVKLTQEGSVSLSVGATNDRLRVEIADTGIGMSDEALLSIFQQHCHIVRSQKEGAVGSGLNLSLSKHLIEQLGGELTLSSQLGTGTKAVFTLPLKRVDGMEHESLPARPIAQNLTTETLDCRDPLTPLPPAITPLSSKQILLVEDNKVNQLVATKMLQKLGIQPVIAVNGEEALALRKAQRFDLILMDVQMPIKDGYTTVAEIRLEEETTGEHQIVIALSVNGLQSDFYKATEMGMDDYITKPIDFSLLTEKLNHWLLTPKAN